jgi:hypothetical protein
MISREDLLAVAELKHLPVGLAETDYLQDIALMIASNRLGNRIIFKGGTCLYKAYKLDRFSEDLDFTAAKRFSEDDFLERMPYFFGLLNINSRIRVERFGSGINVYLDVYGPLYDGTKETVKTIIFNISLRERVLLPYLRYPYLSSYNEVRPFDLFVMDEREILAEKVRAIYTRNKARDVYDLWYLMVRKSITLDLKVTGRKLSYSKIKFAKSSFMTEVHKKGNSWRRDLSALVSGELLDFSQVEEDIGRVIGAD